MNIYQGGHANPQGTVQINQDIYEESSTQKGPLGTILVLGNRKFVYCKNGAAVQYAGQIGVQADLVPNHIDRPCVVATAPYGIVGSRLLKVTLGATAATANQYADGYVHFTDNGPQGRTHRIKRHAAAALSTVITLELYDALLENVAVTDEVYLETCIYSGIITGGDDQAEVAMGVPTVDLTASYYYWAQYWGPCSVLCDVDPPSPGQEITVSDATAGAIGQRDAVTEQKVGIARVLGVSTEYTPVYLTISIF